LILSDVMVSLHCLCIGCMAALPLLQLVLDVRRLMRDQQMKAAEGSVDVVEMASRLSAAGYRVTVRASIRDHQHNSSSILPRAC
jgi:hypothetical protein